MDNDLKTTPYFTHLHVHTHYSILDGMSSIPDLVEKCLRTGMDALAITDHGTMYGIKEFFDYVDKKNSKLRESGGKLFKPIFGCEVYVARQTPTNPTGSRLVKEHKENGSGYHLILLAKNEQGYHNLCKIVSSAWIEGNYYRPRIDRALLEQYHEGLIVASACLAGEVPRALSSGNYEKAKAAALWYKQLFGEDYYLEMQRHPTDKPGGDREVFEQQKPVNEGLLRLSAETGIKIICTNDVHFVEEEHGEAHDRLICLSTGKKWSDTDRLHYTKQEWLKTPEEMAALFADVPEALANTKEIVDKVEFFPLKHAPIMPVFDIPESFGTVEGYREKFSEEDLKAEFESDGVGRIAKLGGLDRVYRIKLESDYLRKLTLDGACKRYGDPIPDDVMERIDFELGVMRNMGFPGYFLIVQDFIAAARSMGVSVGPGRGSAAGSVVAYCLKITDIDPLKYDLLFERFLNPDRISLPDIDVDFDDDGRYKVLNWITEKYGKERVAHIITYGTMATKLSIKDVARVQDLDLAESNRLAKMVPNDLPEDPETHKPAKVNIRNCVAMVPEMKEAYENDPAIHDVLTYASQLEGTVRQTGVHACGVIIGADDLTNFAPLSTVKDKESGEDVLVTQYEGSVVEDVGLIKMDFLGLKTLSIIKDTVENVRKSQGRELDIDTIPIDDEATYQLFCDGNTVATFQFESPGMQKYLKELRPSKFEDLIAMNALYRPGPMDYIPQFINRKQGREPIEYDIPVMEQYLKDTYGITVYQEQVMLLSRLLAGFTRGESDTLRKAMGKKQIAKMMELKDKFLRQGAENGHDPKVLEKVWADWEKFASYAFNKSHATCYSWVAYQTAYLKAHFPAEFMAANLTHNQNNIKEIAILTAECKRMKIPVLGPDVNESDLHFTVNSKGEIRFGLAALKGVGEAASESIVAERRKNGNYTSVVDFLQRVNLRTCNRKCVESLGLAGSFESLGDLRCELFENSDFLERIMRFAARYQERKASIQTSLFGDETVSVEESGMEVPEVRPWSVMQRLQHEKEICGYYVSGHPMDKYRLECRMFSCSTVSELKAFAAESKASKVTYYLAGMLVQADCLTSQKGNEYAKVMVRDYEDEMSLFVFGEVFLKYRHLLQPDYQVLIALQGEVRQNRFSWRVMEVHPLETVMEKFAKRIRLSLPLSQIDTAFSNNLERLCKENSGENKVDVDICVADGSSRLDVTLTMRKGLDVSAFCQQLQAEYPDLPLSVNR
jgi:DNA polymerase-3 subunit alpha